jgi:FlaA1/EpsC-like NDP-sugar epimerase
MSIKEACNLVIQSSVSKYHNRTLFLDMGKPIKILEIIKKMFKIYAQNDQKLKIEIIGNKFNEKLSEKLFFKNKIYSTSIEKVFTLQNKLSNKKKFLGNLDRLLLNIDDLSENDLKNSLTKLLKIR